VIFKAEDREKEIKRYYAVAYVEGGGRDHKPKDDNLRKLGRAKKQILPWSFQKEHRPVDLV
jgi:hypothetical protein